MTYAPQVGQNCTTVCVRGGFAFEDRPFLGPHAPSAAIVIRHLSTQDRTTISTKEAPDPKHHSNAGPV